MLAPSVEPNVLGRNPHKRRDFYTRRDIRPLARSAAKVQSKTIFSNELQIATHLFRHDAVDLILVFLQSWQRIRGKFFQSFVIPVLGV
jgi:hypothetical protein